MRRVPRGVPRGVLRSTLLVPLAVVALSSCGGGADRAADSADPADGSSSGSTSPSADPSQPVPADAPQCEDVWVEGAKIPRSYAGCVELDVWVERDATPCSSGQRLITYDDRFYGVAGGEVRVSEQPLEQDRDYRASVRSCTA